MKLTQKLEHDFPNSIFPWIALDDQYPAFGGSQKWFSKKTAVIGGCGPVAAANTFACLCIRYPRLTKLFQLEKNDENIFNYPSYLSLMEKTYHFMKTWEVPGINYLCNKNLLPKWVPIKPSYGAGIFRYLFMPVFFARKSGLLLRVHYHSVFFSRKEICLKFIQKGLKKSGSVTLLTTKSPHTEAIYSSSLGYLGAPALGKIRSHFVTITGICLDASNHEDSSNHKDSFNHKDSSTSPKILISTWGSVSTVDFNDLWDSWQNIKAFGSALVYFTPENI